MVGLACVVIIGFGFAGGLLPPLVHQYLDIGDLEQGFVVAHCGIFSSVINRRAFDARYFAKSFFHIVHSQDRQTRFCSVSPTIT